MKRSEKIAKPVMKSKTGAIMEGHSGQTHKDIPVRGKHMFKTDKGRMVDRKEGAKVAKKAGQASVKSLHTTDLPATKKAKMK